MYLKKLTLSGFKSFAEPAELIFAPGVSAIVGPNGSGKSNITDAIRWVLGEQSTKSLRGKKMEDVIFSGTEAKKPLNYAEVTLTLDNTSGYIPDQLDEIVITRRLFRSGDSEYRINQKNCKLRDIQALFMDTGLGKNGYSLISQGGIENIINASPAELRNIVEEAVGIVNYKTKKQEAERKLEHTQNNMERLKDILEEIEKQLRPLKAQAEKAREYLKVREALKKVDLYLFYNQMQEAKGRLAELEKQLADTGFDIFETQKKTEEKDRAFQKSREAIRSVREAAAKLQEELTTIRTSIDTAEREQLVAAERIEREGLSQKRLAEEKTQFEQVCATLRQDLAALQEEKAQLTESMDARKAQTEALRNERESLLTDLNSEKAKNQQERAEKEAFEKERETLRQALVDVKTRLARWSTEKSFHADKAEAVAREIRQLTQALEDNHTEAAQNDSLHSRLSREVDSLSQALKEREQQNRQLQQELAVLDNNYKVNASKLDYLKNIQQNYSDYFPSIRAIMHSREDLGSTLDSVYGPVGELIRVASRYTVALDVALGAKSQNIVVETVDTASRCINVLKKRQLGRATFLPMDNLRYSLADAEDIQKLRQVDGFEGLASELVDYAPRYRRVIESLLGRILVTRDFAAGRHIQKQTRGRYTVVTLEGEIFYPGGAIVGGTAKKGKQSPLFKKAEIETLSTEMREQTVRRKALTQKIEKEAEQYRKLQEQHRQRTLRLNSVEQEAWKIEKQAESLGEALAENRKVEEALHGDTGAFAEKEQALQQELAEKEARLSDISRALEENTGEDTGYMDALRDSIETVGRRLSEMRVALARDDENSRALDQQMRMISSQLQTEENRLRRNQADTAVSQETVTASQNRCEALKKAVENLKQTALEKEQDLTAFSETTREETESSERLDQEIRDLNSRLILLKDAQNNAELAKNKIEMQMSHWEETIFEAYEMNMVMVEDMYDSLLPEADTLTESDQRRLKAQIAAMGNINVGAVEEYTALNERFQFMNTQYQDMVKAKGELTTIIDSLYTSMEKQFAQQFAELQKKFSRIFGILFEGGRARIDYTDPENVLESGIELTAQPPGKNLRHISLLSGGEKSMIAIALLFSFLELNPSPFCVIDEIDAALDDHNIYRFTSYLAHIAQNNQFIIITHRKSTLEACDAIYGVSMAQNGISKLVSVRLSDYVEPDER